MMGRWSTLLYAALVFNGMQAVTSNPLGGNQCPNIKGEYETCGYLQFCSESALDKGCRDCSEIYQYWCDDHYEQFRDKYPSCEILCANEKLAKVENALNQSRLDNAKKEQELRYARAENKKLADDNEKIRDLNGKLSKITIGVAIFLMIPIVYLVCQNVFIRKHATHGRLTNGHRPRACAEVNHSRTQCLKRCFCFQAHNQHPIEEEAEQPLQDISVVPSAPPTTNESSDDVDSGKGSNQDSGSDKSCFRLPSGGTEHHVQDTHDFMLQGEQADRRK